MNSNYESFETSEAVGDRIRKKKKRKQKSMLMTMCILLAFILVIAGGFCVWHLLNTVKADHSEGPQNSPVSETGSTSSDSYTSDSEQSSDTLEKEYDEFKNATTSLRNSIEELLDEDGYLDMSKTDEALDLLSASAEELKKQGVVSQYHVQEHNIGILFESGAYYIYELPYFGYDSSVAASWYTPPAPMDASDDANDYIIAIDPFANEIVTTDGEPRGTIADDCRGYIRNFIDPAISDSSLTDENVTIDALQKLQDAQIFLWHGHGGYDEKYGSYLCTGEKLHGISAYAKIAKKGIEGISAGIGTRNGDYLGVNARFFRDDTDFQLTKGMAYLGSCQSGSTDTLADALRGKGAETVFVNRGFNPVFTGYDIIMMQRIMSYMSGDSDGIFHSAGEALEMADEDERRRIQEDYNFSWPENSSYQMNGGEFAVNQGVFVDIVGEREYTIIAGVKGRVLLATASGSQQMPKNLLDRLSVRINETEGHFQEDGTFYIDNVVPSAQGASYTVEISLDGKIVTTVPNVVIESCRYRNLEDIVVGSTVTGTVIDSISGTPVPEVTVTYEDKDDPSNTATTTADKDGKYTFENVPAGNYNLRFTHEYYKDGKAEQKVGADPKVYEVETVELEPEDDNDWYSYIRDNYVEKWGYASLETTSKRTNDSAYSQHYDVRNGVLSVQIEDLNKDGTDECAVYYLDKSMLYISILTTDKNGRVIEKVNRELYELYGLGFEFFDCVGGIIESGGKKYIYVEAYSNAYFANGYDAVCYFYAYDGINLRPEIIVGKTEGGSIGFVYSIDRYDINGKFPKYTPAKYNHGERYTRTILCTDGYKPDDWDISDYDTSIMMDDYVPEEAMALGMEIITDIKPDIVTLKNADCGYAFGDEFPTYRNSNILTLAFHFNSNGPWEQESRNITITVEDNTNARQMIEK